MDWICAIGLRRRRSAGKKFLFMDGELELKISSSFAIRFRRRLPVVMVRSHMAENLKAATKFVEHGHVRVGPELIMDPAFLVPR